MECRSVALDGPSGAGKSTMAKAAAKEFGFIYVDTGALYRAIGLFMLNNGISTTDESAVSARLSELDIQLKFIDGEQKVFLNGKDVSSTIRKNEVSMAASNVSALPPVRIFLLELQQSIGEKNNVVMDGRDIGTVVLPNADVKIFLTASAEERARRRCEELKERGEQVDFDKLLKEINERDYNDSHREIAPLKQADDAILLDTTGNEIDQSISLIIQLIKDTGLGLR